MYFHQGKHRINLLTSLLFVVNEKYEEFGTSGRIKECG